jgi:hypothetical protein
MATKARRHKPQQVAQNTDYETDYADIPPAAMRTNEELNISVLHRHYPSITTILSIAPYAVLYIFSPTNQQWEKSGVEGTLFVCAQELDALGAEHFSVVILNRRGLENFEAELKSKDDIEITDEYVILKGEGEEGPIIYGLWIFAEPPPSSTADCRITNAAVIQECANRAESSRAIAQEQHTLREQQAKEAKDRNNVRYIVDESDQEEASVPMGRQLSLSELFGKQREQDSGFSVRHHESPKTQSAQLARQQQQQEQYQQQHQQQQQPQTQQQRATPQQVLPPAQASTPQFITHPDTDFFRSGPRFSTPQAQNGTASSTPGPNGGEDGSEAFLLYRKAYGQ